ncbi:MAG: hypothetical protein AAF198_06200 [Pseudomonadota bacterium]
MTFSPYAGYLDAEQVALTVLFKIEFTSQTYHLACRNTGITDLTGQYWEPANSSIISYEDFMTGASLAASKRTYTLSLPDSVFGNKLVSQESEYRGRSLSQYMQILDFDTDAPVGPTHFLHTGFMDSVSSTLSPDGTAVLSVTAEGPLSYKNRSSYGLLTDTDQKARYSDDEGLDRVKELSLGVTVVWPPA